MASWTLITVTHNSAEALHRHWARGVPQDIEWIVVDNASTDDTVRVARQLGALVVPLAQNLGFATANNRGLAQANGNYIGFVNPDVTVEFNDLEKLRESIELSGGLLSPQLMNTDGSLQPNGRGLPTPYAKVRNRVARLRSKDDGYRIVVENENLVFVSWLTGAVVCGAIETLRELRGWNEHFFLYYEDSELGMRAWDLGVPSLIDGRVRWTHGWARETMQLKWKPWRREIASATRFYSHYPWLLLGAAVGRRRYRAACDSAGIAAVRQEFD